MAWEKKAFTCAEMRPPDICAPKKLSDLFEDVNIQLSNRHEVFLCILHVLVTEENFVPCSTLNLWHKTHFYSISYTHPTTGDVVCQLKYLPLDSSGSAIVFAVSGTKEVAKQHIDCNLYVKDETNKNPTQVYKDVSNLSAVFKDNIVKNMLAGAQEYANVDLTFGLHILATEMKLEILYRMDATGLLALSSVNQEFHQLIDSAIWQHALFRDFPKHRGTSEGDWKALYKIEYLAKKEADKALKERLKKEKEKMEKELALRRIRGMGYFGDPGHMPFGDYIGPPRRYFGFPPEPQRRNSGFSPEPESFGFPPEPLRRHSGFPHPSSKRRGMATIHFF